MEAQRTLRPGELLAEMIGVDYEATEKTVEQRLMELALSKNVRPTVRDLPEDARREYMREAKRKSREARKERADAGNVDASPEAIREALADAALMILAADAPGAAQVMKALSLAFPGKCGVPITVQGKARTGKLRPKLIKLG